MHACVRARASMLPPRPSLRSPGDEVRGFLCGVMPYLPYGRDIRRCTRTTGQGKDVRAKSPLLFAGPRVGAGGGR